MTLLMTLALALQAPVDEEPFKLKNGLTVLLRPSSGGDKVALVVLFSVGGDHDPKGKSGLAHLVEHLYAGERHVNAQTGDRYTVIAGEFAKKNLGEELRDAAERMGGLKIDQKSLDHERERLLLEVENMFGAMPALGAFNCAAEKLRPTPRGGRRGGHPDHVKTITLDEVRDHWKKYYKPRNAILVLAGGFDAKEARDAISKNFEDLAGGEALPEPGAPGKPQPGGHEEREEKPVAEGAKPHAALVFAAPAPDSELYAPYLAALSRFMMTARKLGAGPGEFPIRMALFDDPTRAALIVPLKKDETAKDAVSRLDAYVSESLQEPLQDSERGAMRRQLGMMLGITPVPEEWIGMNPYFVAFTAGRRLQMGIDSAKLGKAIDELKEEDFRRAIEIFGPGKRAAVVVRPK